MRCLLILLLGAVVWAEQRIPELLPDDDGCFMPKDHHSTMSKDVVFSLRYDSLYDISLNTTWLLRDIGVSPNSFRGWSPSVEGVAGFRGGGINLGLYAGEGPLSGQKHIMPKIGLHRTWRAPDHLQNEAWYGYAGVEAGFMFGFYPLILEAGALFNNDDNSFKFSIGLGL